MCPPWDVGGVGVVASREVGYHLHRGSRSSPTSRGPTTGGGPLGTPRWPRVDLYGCWEFTGAVFGGGGLGPESPGVSTACPVSRVPSATLASVAPGVRF